MSKSLFYGWTLLGAFWLVLFVNLAFPAYGAGVINNYMAVDLHLNRQMVGLPYSVYLLMSGLPGPLAALCVNRRGIRFTHYLPDFANATVKIDDPSSPLAKGLPPSFVIDREEWYTWSQSPRPNVSVLASVDESSYVPNTMIKMGGDHPVVWSNSHFKARNVYIFMGHHGGLFDNPNFVQLFRNAIFWGAGQ